MLLKPRSVFRFHKEKHIYWRSKPGSLKCWHFRHLKKITVSLGPSCALQDVSSIPGLYLLNTSSTLPTLAVSIKTTTKCLLRGNSHTMESHCVKLMAWLKIALGITQLILSESCILAMNQHHWQAICFSVAVCGWNTLFSLTFHVTLANPTYKMRAKTVPIKI